MNKQDWEEIKQQLKPIQRDFYRAQDEAENGKNKGIKATGYRQAQRLISRAKTIFLSDPEITRLMGISDKPLSATYHFDDYSSLNYFSDDIGNLMRKIDDKIDEMD